MTADSRRNVRTTSEIQYSNRTRVTIVSRCESDTANGSVRRIQGRDKRGAGFAAMVNADWIGTFRLADARKVPTTAHESGDCDSAVDKSTWNREDRGRETQ